VEALPRDRRRRGLVLGGGCIGLEMAEALQRRGLEVSVVLADPLPVQLLDVDMGERVCAAMVAVGMTADDLSASDLSYAPPFCPAYDPVAVAARAVGRT
jgi:pyruvate/2-oxoglutarate dehydrogenase complex dihydrolipoamide dehydrogenase (E3) component